MKIVLIAMVMLLAISACIAAPNYPSASKDHPYWVGTIDTGGRMMRVYLDDGKGNRAFFSAPPKIMWTILKTLEVDKEGRALIVTDFKPFMEARTAPIVHEQTETEKCVRDQEIVGLFATHLAKGKVMATQAPGLQVEDKEPLASIKGTYGDFRRALESIYPDKAWQSFLKSVKESKGGTFYLKEADKDSFPFTVRTPAHYVQVVERTSKGDVDDAKLIITMSGDVIYVPKPK